MPQRYYRATGHQGNRPTQKVPAGPSSRDVRGLKPGRREGSERKLK